jgi:hypothetical protein
MREDLTVPPHEELDRGALQAIYRQASRSITPAELRSHFHADRGRVSAAIHSTGSARKF